MPQQRQQPVADEVGGGLLTADHGDDDVRHHLLLGEPVAIDLGRGQCVDQPLGGVSCLASHRLAEIGGHRLHAGQHSGRPPGVVLKVAQHLGEVLRPVLELAMVFGGHAEHLRRDDRGQGFAIVSMTSISPSAITASSSRR